MSGRQLFDLCWIVVCITFSVVFFVHFIYVSLTDDKFTNEHTNQQKDVPFIVAAGVKTEESVNGYRGIFSAQRAELFKQHDLIKSYGVTGTINKNNGTVANIYCPCVVYDQQSGIAEFPNGLKGIFQDLSITFSSSQYFKKQNCLIAYEMVEFTGKGFVMKGKHAQFDFSDEKFLLRGGVTTELTLELDKQQ